MTPVAFSLAWFLLNKGFSFWRKLIFRATNATTRPLCRHYNLFIVGVASTCYNVWSRSKIENSVLASKRIKESQSV